VHRLARQNGTASRAGPTKVPTQPVWTLAANRRHTAHREKKPPGPWLCGKGIHADWRFEEIPVRPVTILTPLRRMASRADWFRSFQTALIGKRANGFRRTAGTSDRNCIVRHSSKTGGKVIGAGWYPVRATPFCQSDRSGMHSFAK
jgi:hypothetical protein